MVALSASPPPRAADAAPVKLRLCVASRTHATGVNGSSSSSSAAATQLGVAGGHPAAAAWRHRGVSAWGAAVALPSRTQQGKKEEDGVLPQQRCLGRSGSHGGGSRRRCHPVLRRRRCQTAAQQGTKREGGGGS